MVDDGSSDGTDKVLAALAGLDRPGHQPPGQPGQGSGHPHRAGVARGDLVLIQDADLEYDPDDWPRLLEPILKGKAQVVYGSRFTGERKNMLPLHWIGNRFLSLVTNVLYSLDAVGHGDLLQALRPAGPRGHHHRVGPVRLRAGDHGQGAAAGLPDLRGADLLCRPGGRRGQEDHLAGRLRRAQALVKYRFARLEP